MQRTTVLAVLTGFVTVGFLAADASAMYHPALGRFMQRDPAEYSDGMGLYQFVGSGPTGSRDPLGTETIRYRGLTWEDFKGHVQVTAAGYSSTGIVYRLFEGCGQGGCGGTTGAVEGQNPPGK